MWVFPPESLLFLEKQENRILSRFGPVLKIPKFKRWNFIGLAHEHDFETLKAKERIYIITV